MRLPLLHRFPYALIIMPDEILELKMQIKGTRLYKVEKWWYMYHCKFPKHWLLSPLLHVGPDKNY